MNFLLEIYYEYIKIKAIRVSIVKLVTHSGSNKYIIVFNMVLIIGMRNWRV